MMVMTAKVNKKRIGLILAVIVGIIVLIFSLTGGGSSDNDQGQPVGLTTNDQRVAYLNDYGWEVVVSPIQTRQVRIPSELSEVFLRYNELQVSQGFDLSRYTGKTVTQYVYQVENYPNATDPVYATLLIYDDQVIGADVTDTSATGVVQGLRMPG